MSDKKAITDLLEVTKRLGILTLAIGASARQLVFDEPHNWNWSEILDKGSLVQAAA